LSNVDNLLEVFENHNVNSLQNSKSLEIIEDDRIKKDNIWLEYYKIALIKEDNT